jgi:hypothetical protein
MEAFRSYQFQSRLCKFDFAFNVLECGAFLSPAFIISEPRRVNREASLQHQGNRTKLHHDRMFASSYE